MIRCLSAELLSTLLGNIIDIIASTMKFFANLSLILIVLGCSTVLSLGHLLTGTLGLMKGDINHDSKYNSSNIEVISSDLSPLFPNGTLALELTNSKIDAPIDNKRIFNYLINPERFSIRRWLYSKFG